MATVDDIITELHAVANLPKGTVITQADSKNLDELITILTELVKFQKISSADNLIKLFEIVCFVNNFSISTKRYFLNNLLIPKNDQVLQSCIKKLLQCFAKVSFFNTTKDVFINKGKKRSSSQRHGEQNSEDENSEDEEDDFEDPLYSMKLEVDEDPLLKSKSLQHDILHWFISTFPLWEQSIHQAENVPFYADLYSKCFYLITYDHLRSNVIILLVLLTTRTNCKPFRARVMIQNYKKSKDYKFLILYKLFHKMLPIGEDENEYYLNNCNRRIELFIKRKIKDMENFFKNHYSNKDTQDSNIWTTYKKCMIHGTLALLLDQKDNNDGTFPDEEQKQNWTRGKISANEVTSFDEFITLYPKLTLPSKTIPNLSCANDFSLLYLVLNPSRQIEEELGVTALYHLDKNNYTDKTLNLCLYYLYQLFRFEGFQQYNAETMREKNAVLPYQHSSTDLSPLLELPSMDMESIYFLISTITKTLIQHQNYQECLHYIQFFRVMLFKILNQCMIFQHDRYLSLSFVHTFQLILRFEQEAVNDSNIGTLLWEPSDFYTLITKLNDPLILNYICKIVVKFRPFIEESCLKDQTINDFNAIVITLANALWKNTNSIYKKGVFGIKGPFVTEVIESLYNFDTYKIKKKDFFTIAGLCALQYAFRVNFLEIMNSYSVAHFPYPVTEAGYLQFLKEMQEHHSVSAILKDYPTFEALKIQILCDYPYKGVKQILFTSVKSLRKYAQSE
ncbi:hypothetical protein ACO0QE_001917 [Hanseniaspora vineae]